VNIGLIGHTGFVGQNILECFEVKYLYNSKNISSLKDAEYDILFCAAPSAMKWKANQEPQQDLEQIFNLIQNIKNVKTKKFILFSTIDVYSKFPSNEENMPIIQDACFYGKNRILLENYISNFFENSTIIRLPGLFGKYLKKNIIFDLLNNNLLGKINSEDSYQWFYLNDLKNVIQYSLNNNIKLLNVTTEPVTNREIIQNLFPNNIHMLIENKKVSYDMRSIYFENSYMFSKQQIMEKLEEYVRIMRI
jgi:nucleoside-diphosphate-sugar epimerase